MFTSATSAIGRTARSFRQQSHPHRKCAPARPRQSLSASRSLDSNQAGATSETLRSLDNILGSLDGADLQDLPSPVEATAAIQEVQPLYVPGWAWLELCEPRVVPLASNVLYYLLLVVYSSYYVIQLAEGQEVADDVLSRLVNDHTAVAAGDTLRLFTCFFVADTLPQLIISLVALATVAAELESLLGYSTFWAIWCLTVLSGSVADAAFSELPITAGPAAGVAGVAAALLAHHLHNWRIEVLMQQAQTGDVPQSWLQLEQQFSWQHKQRQQQEEGEALQPSLTASINSSRSSSSSSSILGQAAGGSSTADHADEVSLVRTEIEGPVGMSFELLLPKEGKAFLTLGGTAVAVVSALKDAADTDIATDWAALIAGFLAGGFLGWMACPVYRLVLTPASSNSSSSSSSSVSYAARNVASPTASAAAAAAVNSSADPEELQPDLLLPVLRDERLPAARANAVLGFAAVLFAVLGGWLTSQGLFI